MDRYQNFTLEDFVWDDQFRSWVLRPTREDEAKWQHWMSQYPDKIALINRAKEIVRAIGVESTELSAFEKRAAIRNIIAKLRTTEPLVEATAQTPFFQQSWLRYAASLLLLCGLAWGIMSRKEARLVDYEELVTSTDEQLIEKLNTTDKPIRLLLEDGSEVTLDPGSKISYPEHFNSQKRELYLSGEAFFSIAKLPSRPFYVYANEVVTKVLGTSFYVRSYQNEKEVSVTVKTGRVAVFTRSDPTLDKKLSEKELKGVVIEPNQQIVVVRESVRITKSLIAQPELITENGTTFQFEFDEVPVSNVFSEIQKAYRVDIIYDKNIMDGCPITANLTDLSLYEKLDLACKAVGAHYELIDGRVIIEGEGCK